MTKTVKDFELKEYFKVVLNNDLESGKFSNLFDTYDKAVKAGEDALRGLAKVGSYVSFTVVKIYSLSR